MTFFSDISFLLLNIQDELILGTQKAPHPDQQHSHRRNPAAQHKQMPRHSPVINRIPEPANIEIHRIAMLDDSDGHFRQRFQRAGNRRQAQPRRSYGAGVLEEHVCLGEEQSQSDAAARSPRHSVQISILINSSIPFHVCFCKDISEKGSMT